MNLAQAVKCCTRCKAEKPLTEFYSDNWARCDRKDSWCKDCVRQYNLKYYATHKEELKAYSKKYSREHQEQSKLWRKLHYRKNKISIDRKNHEWQHRTTILLREQVLRRFGGKCERCGFADPRALQIDHIHGDGAEERKRSRGIGFLEKLVGLPELELRRKYQLLCANCQWIKRRENHEHKGRYEKESGFKVTVS